jgi:hypothetical protein
MTTFVLQLGKTPEGGPALQVQDIVAATAATDIPMFFISLALSHLHVLTSVDETFDHIPVTEKLEDFMAARDVFTEKLMQVIWKHRGSAIAEKAEDEEWLQNALNSDR